MLRQNIIKQHRGLWGHTTTFRRPGLRRVHDSQARRENLAVDYGEILAMHAASEQYQ